jgi:orotate phosphoribosyltransferase
MNKRLLQILKEKAYEKKTVTLASGRVSDFYIDVKRVSLMAEGSLLIGQGLFEIVRTHFQEAKAIGGLTLGADPLATAASIASFEAGRPIDAFIVRKEAKGHGLGRLIEGGYGLAAGSPVVVVEDVVTTGSSSLEAARKVQDFGWKVLGIAAVVDREEGGRENIEKAGFTLYSLFRRSDFS